MNELQQTELELLRAFLRVCGALGLRYYLVCGSALGAAKYGGFIPWDDDVDVAMPREDYETFCREAPRLLPAHLFLQNYRSDPAFPGIYSKLRDSDTTYIERGTAHLPMHHGVYLDLFPLDGYPRGRLAQRWFELRKRLYKHQLAAAFDLERRGAARALYRLNRALGMHRRTQTIARRYTALIRRYPTQGSSLWCNHGNWQGTLDYADPAQYGQGAWADFEGLKVRIPAEFDRYLTQKYGDWRGELPPEEQRGHHEAVLCDLNRPCVPYGQAAPGKGK